MSNAPGTSHVSSATRPRVVNKSRPIGIAGLVVLVLGIVLVGSIFVPPIVLRDADAPTRLAPYVDSARRSVGQNIDGLLPSHLRYVAARCRSDGGAVLVFEQWQPPYVGPRYAYAMAGAVPPSGWSGGTSFEDLRDDPEIAFFLGSNEVDCE